MRIEKMYRKNRFKRWVLLSMGILGLMLLAGIFSALDHRVDYGGMETAEQGWTRALTEGASGWEAETKALPELLTLVNREHPLPEDWECELVDIPYGQHVDRRVYEDLQELLADARAEGFSPYICSSYRSHETQVRLYGEEIEKYRRRGYSKKEAEAEAGRWVAVPGTSEHELGLALDIVSMENQTLDESQMETEFQKWMMEHCTEYGFILRYPVDKGEITGIGFEPWHYRYVGREDAEKIKESGLCLEEYVAQEIPGT